MLNFLSPPEIIRVCRGTLTPLDEYVSTLALHLTAQANEQPGVVAALEEVRELLTQAVKDWEATSPTKPA